MPLLTQSGHQSRCARLRSRAGLLISIHAVLASRCYDGARLGPSEAPLATERVDRRLTAILAADVAGYSRLMGMDEEGTLAQLKAHRRALVDPKITEHRGRIVKTTGDGMLVEFASVVDAVRCAVEVQRSMAERNAEVPHDKCIEFRVGIHQGDVIIEGGDIFGDGVNVAARLEGFAEPGGICVSGRVHEDVQGKLDICFEDAGEHQFKNIARPVHVLTLPAAAVANLPAFSRGRDSSSSPLSGWRIWASAALALLFVLAGIATWWLRGETADHRLSSPATTAETVPRLSILVLPFENLSHDPDQEYFADGITQDLTTDLSRIPDSFVIAVNTALTFKSKPVDVKQIGHELGVRYILEGSVQRTGDQVRVNAQLVDAQTGAHLWADRFDGDRSRLGQLQDEVTARLSRTLDVQLTEAESLRAERERPKNPDAVDLAMRGWASLNHGRSRENYTEARDLFEAALRIDRQLPRALDGLAYALIHLVRVQWSVAPDQARADEVVATALQIRPNDAIAHMIKGYIFLYQKRFEDAIAAFEVAIANGRNLAEAYAIIGNTNTLRGHADEAFAPIETAIRLSPRDPLLNIWLFYIGHAYTHLGQDLKAIEWCRKSVTVKPFWVAYVDLVSAYAWTGQKEQAQSAMRELLKLMPGYTVTKWATADWSDNPVFLQQYARIVEGLRKAGLPE